MWSLLSINNSHICTINIRNRCLRNLTLWDWNKIIQLHRSTAALFKHCMASLGFLHQLVNEKMEAVQMWERRIVKELNVQVLLQPLKLRPHLFKKDSSGMGHRSGNPVPAAQHTGLVLTLNPFYTSFDEQLLLWCRSLLINLPSAQVTPRSCLAPCGQWEQWPVRDRKSVV